MEFDSISPAISGVMGGMLATSLVALVAQSAWRLQR